MTYAFGCFRLDAAARTLTRSGAPVTVAPKTFDLLILMVASAGCPLSKRELMDSPWNGAYIEEAPAWPFIALENQPQPL
jgi:DNA-binding winged helix-turn-helix (wHTH) protein